MAADYTVIRDGFMAKARTIVRLNTNELYFAHPFQVTDDEAAVNRGADFYMILKPGAAPIAYVPEIRTKKIYDVNWNVIFDLQVKYKSFAKSWNDFSRIRDAVLNKFVFTIDKSLTGTVGVWDVMITAPEPPGQKPPEGAPAWVGQQMVAVITQRIDVTR